MAEDSKMDAVGVVEGYLKQTNWKSRENSNMVYSFSSVFFRAAGEAMERYALNKVYSQDIARHHKEGDFHVHDLYMGIVGYCAGWSITDILMEGFNGVPTHVESSPAKHFDTALLQLANYLGTMQNEWAGAQALNSLDTLLAPYVREDGLGYDEVEQGMQEFIYNLNIASRWGGQTPFTNITFDLRPPDDLKDQPAAYAGGLLDSCYSDYQEEMDMINKAFCGVMSKGDMGERIFTFPIPTYNLTDDFPWESEVTEEIFQMTAKYGNPYFQNFINSKLDPGEVRAMCCRLQLDLGELHRRIGGTFGYADKTGSVGVVTINMPRLGYLSDDEDEFLESLGGLMELARDSLELKRDVVMENIEGGLLPFTDRYLGTLKYHFSTIGLVGMNEACLNLLNVDIGTKEGRSFSLKVLDYMLHRSREFQEETGHIYNLEATPAEGSSYRLARIDRERYPDIITSGERVPYYTNSTHLPVSYTSDLYEALKHQERLQSKYTGGTVFHVFLGERISDPDSCKLLVRRIAENFIIPYFTITPTFSVCPDHGYVAGEQFECPVCGKGCEVYSRVVGYHRPVQNWHQGKREEFQQRKTYEV